MIRPKCLLFLIVFGMMISGCMSTKLVANYDSDNVIHNKTTKVTYLWGVIQPRDVPAACESKTICQVSSQTNIGFIFVSCITLGIVVPQTIVWDCCPKKLQEEVIR